MVEDIRLYCLSKPGAVEIKPFRHTSDCSYFQIHNKIFAVLDIEDGLPTLTLKCHEQWIKEQLCMNSKQISLNENSIYWSKFPLNNDIDEAILHDMIDYSYSLMA